MKKNGLAEEPERPLVESAFLLTKVSHQAMNRLLDRNLNITAVFAMSDVMAALRRLGDRDRGLQVQGNSIPITGLMDSLANYIN
ncbi:MAG: hypothetical protein V8S31_00615 [Lachnospiraceae bacterium]